MMREELERFQFLYRLRADVYNRLRKESPRFMQDWNRITGKISGLISSEANRILWDMVEFHQTTEGREQAVGMAVYFDHPEDVMSAIQEAPNNREYRKMVFNFMYDRIGRNFF